MNITYEIEYMEYDPIFVPVQVVTIGGQARIAKRIAADKLAHVVNNRKSSMLKFVQVMVIFVTPIKHVKSHTKRSIFYAIPV